MYRAGHNTAPPLLQMIVVPTIVGETMLPASEQFLALPCAAATGYRAFSPRRVGSLILLTLLLSLAHLFLLSSD